MFKIRKAAEGIVKLAFSPDVASPSLTVHNQPDWLEDFKKKFAVDIVGVCSERTREAVQKNKNIQACDYFLHIVLYKIAKF